MGRETGRVARGRQGKRRKVELVRDAIGSNETEGECDSVDALEGLLEALRASASRLPLAEALAVRAVRLYAEGVSYREIIRSSERPLLLDIATMDLEAIAAAGTRLRRLTARALRDEGMTLHEIANELGVSRQRVDRLLRGDPDSPGPSWRHRETST
jgi:hypothetical protein